MRVNIIYMKLVVFCLQAGGLTVMDRLARSRLAVPVPLAQHGLGRAVGR